MPPDGAKKEKAPGPNPNTNYHFLLHILYLSAVFTFNSSLPLLKKKVLVW
jgi:hypothetical protein